VETIKTEKTGHPASPKSYDNQTIKRISIYRKRQTDADKKKSVRLPKTIGTPISNIITKREKKKNRTKIHIIYKHKL
jgi:hypothetical protein